MTVHVPLDDGEGGTDEQSFKVRFKYLDVGELNEALSKLSVARDADTVVDYIVGWDGLADEEGKTLVYSEDNCREIMKIPFIAVGINEAFIDCQVGAERKN